MKINIDLLIQYAMSFIGVNYLWGGDDPMRGYDCSGYIQEILASQGWDPKGDQTAQNLYDYFKHMLPHTRMKRGSLLFFGVDHKNITHVALALDGRYMIEAGGGGSTTTSKEAAERANAFVRIRPVRFDLVGCFDLGSLGV